MNLSHGFHELALLYLDQSHRIQSCETTRSTLVLPFIGLLGFDTFNPLEVITDFTEETNGRQREEIDFLIRKNGRDILLLECVWCGNPLENAVSRKLVRSFAVSDARIGIFTNGVVYRFFVDLETPGKLDPFPFFVFDLLNFSPEDLNTLLHFTRRGFNTSRIIQMAKRLRYIQKLKADLVREHSGPLDKLVETFRSPGYPGRQAHQFISQTHQFMNLFLSNLSLHRAS